MKFSLCGKIETPEGSVSGSLGANLLDNDGCVRSKEDVGRLIEKVFQNMSKTYSNSIDDIYELLSEE